MELDERQMGHLGESQGHAQVTSPFEMIPKSKSGQRQKPRQKPSPEKERRQKPGCHKPPPLRMNLVLEIWLLGKTILDRMPLKIPLSQVASSSVWCSH